METAIVSRFKEAPKTKMGWWAMGLGLGTLLIGPMLGIFAAVGRPILDKLLGEELGGIMGLINMSVATVLLVLAVSANIRAFRSGERSWAVWVGLVPCAFSTLMISLLIVGEFLIPH